jgi:hypothetical protein
MANLAIESQLIFVDHSSKEETMREELISISEELMDLVNLHKKKIKEKEYY